MPDLYTSPFQFIPLYKEKIWGGAALNHVLGKPTPKEALIGESWEISGWGESQTVVSDGPFAGVPLGELVKREPQKILGGYAAKNMKFPLLIKFIDAAKNLSVQVHPNRQQALRYGWGTSGKTECWYIISAKAGAQIIIGFKRDVTNDEVCDAVASGSLDTLLNYLPVKTGDMFFIPAGTVHAILEGTLIYEIQEESDTTLRLYDWHRKTADGSFRELHVEQALQIADFSSKNVYRPGPVVVDKTDNYCYATRCQCSNFLVEQYDFFSGSGSAALEQENSFRVISVIHGTIQILYPSGSLQLGKGQTALLPAIMSAVIIQGNAGASVLKTSVPG